MKNLYLMRHGKSSWELNVSDQDRPLGQRGISDAHLIGQKLAEQNFMVDHVFSSPANRALHTCMICLKELAYPLQKFTVVPDLYDFSGEKVLNIIQNIDDSLNSILLFGHNHAFTYLANNMGNKHIDNVPTSGFVHLRSKEKSWANFTEGSTIQTIFPKQLKAW